MHPKSALRRIGPLIYSKDIHHFFVFFCPDLRRILFDGVVAHHIRIVGVGSSNLLKSTKKTTPPLGWCCFLVWHSRRGDSNNQMQRSGGALLVPGSTGTTPLLTNLLKSTMLKTTLRWSFILVFTQIDIGFQIMYIVSVNIPLF